MVGNASRPPPPATDGRRARGAQSIDPPDRCGLGGLLIVVAVVVAIWLALVVVIWLHRPSRHLAGAALRLLPDVLRMLRALVVDPAAPRRERWLLVGLFAWRASPIDLLPEFLPGIGPLDDIVVAALVLRWVARRLGRDYLRAHWPGNDHGFALVERLL